MSLKDDWMQAISLLTNVVSQLTADKDQLRTLLDRALADDPGWRDDAAALPADQ